MGGKYLDKSNQYEIAFTWSYDEGCLGALYLQSSLLTVNRPLGSQRHCICFLSSSLQMKAWAKAYDINSPKDRTLSSLSLISLVAFHLQVR